MTQIPEHPDRADSAAGTQGDAPDLSKVRPAPQYGLYAPGFDPNQPASSATAAPAAPPAEQAQQPSPYGQYSNQGASYDRPISGRFDASGPVLPKPKTNTLSIVSLVAGIVGLVGFTWTIGLASILAVITGHFALSQVKRTRSSGRGLAITGLVLGYVGVAFLLFIIVLIAAIVANPSLLDSLLSVPGATDGLTPDQLNQLRDLGKSV